MRDPDFGSILFRTGIGIASTATRTDNEGRFTLARLPVGSMISLHAAHPDHAQSYAWDIPVSAGEGEIPTIRLPEGIARIFHTK